MQQMCGRMVASDVAPPRGRDARDDVAELDLAGERPERGRAAVDLPHVVDIHAPLGTSRADYLAAIRDLAPGFGVERRAAKNPRDARIAEPAYGHHVRLHVDGVVA